jgi:hypothetical protein
VPRSRARAPAKSSARALFFRGGVVYMHLHETTGRRIADYWLAGVPVATRVKAGVAAILTSTSLTGFWVQAWVT